jgi:hypothetical protein
MTLTRMPRPFDCAGQHGLGGLEQIVDRKAEGDEPIKTR